MHLRNAFGTLRRIAHQSWFTTNPALQVRCGSWSRSLCNVCSHIPKASGTPQMAYRSTRLRMDVGTAEKRESKLPRDNPQRESTSQADDPIDRPYAANFSRHGGRPTEKTSVAHVIHVYGSHAVRQRCMRQTTAAHPREFFVHLQRHIVQPGNGGGHLAPDRPVTQHGLWPAKLGARAWQGRRDVRFFRRGVQADVSMS